MFNHIWIIEAKSIHSKDRHGEWHPMVGEDCFFTRRQAREVAKRLYKENKYNYAFVKGRDMFLPIVKYRAAKYIREKGE